MAVVSASKSKGCLKSAVSLACFHEQFESTKLSSLDFSPADCFSKNRCASFASSSNRYDNALAETINGFYKAEVIHRKSSWRKIDDVEMATLKWVDWFNNRRLPEPIGNIPPNEAEELYYAQINQLELVA